MNYYVLFLITTILLILVYTPGIITLNFSKINRIIQFTFIPFAQWTGTTLDIKGVNWFFAAPRVLGGTAIKYNEDGSEQSNCETIGYFFRLFGMELEYIIIKNDQTTNKV